MTAHRIGAFAALLVGTALVGGIAFADFTPARWEFQKPIVLSGTGMSRVTLDLPVLDRANANLGDLRIIDGAGTEVPYALRDESTYAAVREVSARLSDLASVPGSHTSFVLDLGGAGTFHNRVTLKTTSENFRRGVTVETSADRVGWAVATDRGQVFDVTVRDAVKPFKATALGVDYPSSTQRFLRVTVRDAGETPLAITGAVVERAVEASTGDVAAPASFRSEQKAAERETDIIADAGARGARIARISLRIATPAFARSVWVSASTDGTNWQSVGSGYLFRITERAFTGENLVVTFAPVRARWIKLTIADGDDVPLAVEELALGIVPQRLLFRADAGTTYALAYGNPDARTPSYDLARISTYVEDADTKPATLGPEARNTAFVPKQAPVTERAPWALPVLLGVIVVALGTLVAKLIRRTAPPPPPAV